MKLLIIIPCLNEEASIKDLLEELANLNYSHSTIVIDDGSSDSTYERAINLSTTIKLVKNLGIGGAVQTGFKFAKLHNFDLCLQIDGDGQHPVSQIPKLLRSYQEKPCSILIGSRYISNDSFRSTFARRFGSKIIAWTINRLFGLHNITDPTSGMRLMDRKAIELFSSSYPRDYPEPISLAQALNKGLSIRECSVQMRSRDSGKSSIYGFRSVAYMIRVIGYIILIRLIRKID